ncbi:hypothetical protein BPTFM16_01241 [Altererythrobacter insulae]|nr:hypothetical protein BPTFM16_01241 [Altererythrobacter insulae]
MIWPGLNRTSGEKACPVRRAALWDQSLGRKLLVRPEELGGWTLQRGLQVRGSLVE